MNNVRQNYRIVVLSLFVFASSFQKKEPQNQQLCSVKLVFNNTVHGSKIVLNDSTYSNAFGENYVVTKLRYYVTNILLQQADNNFKEKEKVEQPFPGARSYKSVQGISTFHSRLLRVKMIR